MGLHHIFFPFFLCHFTENATSKKKSPLTVEQKTDGPDAPVDHDTVVPVPSPSLPRIRHRNRPDSITERLHGRGSRAPLLHALVCPVDGHRGRESLHPAGSRHGCAEDAPFHARRLSCRLG